MIRASAALVLFPTVANVKIEKPLHFFLKMIISLVVFIAFGSNVSSQVTAWLANVKTFADIYSFRWCIWPEIWYEGCFIGHIKRVRVRRYTVWNIFHHLLQFNRTQIITVIFPEAISWPRGRLVNFQPLYGFLKTSTARGHCSWKTEKRHTCFDIRLSKL